MRIECHAQRLLNPFRGALHVVRYGSAEAVTQDGRHWDIYVSDEELAYDLDPEQRVQVNDIRFGAWSAEAGLRRGPIYPSEDFRRLEALGEIVHECLPDLGARVPFAFRDRFELWLLDASDCPLALLHSAVSVHEMLAGADLEWRAGHAARERFRSEAIWGSSEAQAAGNAADALTRLVNRAAGPAPVAQWFQREADGGGLGMHCVGARGVPPRRLGKDEFPELLLGQPCEQPGSIRLVEDYLAWQAVWLLTLPGLEDTTRRRLETQARLQAGLVDGLFGLYPRILDAAAINAARVEARLRQSLGAGIEPVEAEMDVLLEMNPASGLYT